MSQLTLGTIPGFTDLPDSELVGDKPVTDEILTALNQNAKFAALRPERISMGWYKHADVIPLPVSPVDGYEYVEDEVQFDVVGFASRRPNDSFVPGQGTRPTMASGNAGPGNVYWFFYDIDEETREVSCSTSYYIEGGAETPTNDGMVKVRATCIRASVDN